LVQAGNHHDPVGDLQARLADVIAKGAEKADTPPHRAHPRRTASNGLSRTAHLHLTNLLARPLPFCFVAVFVASFYAAAPGVLLLDPASLVWLLMIALTLSFLARQGFGYRSGQHQIASRPLRWRAYHRAAMGVLGVILACGPFLLTTPASPSMIPLLVITGAGAMTALLQACDRNTSLRFIMPILIGDVLYLCTLGTTPIGTMIGGLMIGLALLTALLFLSNRAETKARLDYPPTHMRTAADNVASLRPVRVHRNKAEHQRHPETAQAV